MFSQLILTPLKWDLAASGTVVSSSILSQRWCDLKCLTTPFSLVEIDCSIPDDWQKAKHRVHFCVLYPKWLLSIVSDGFKGGLNVCLQSVAKTRFTEYCTIFCEFGATKGFGDACHIARVFWKTSENKKQQEGKPSTIMSHYIGFGIVF